MASTAPPVFRFAPSPNGALHLGHAYSAIVNQQICDMLGGKYLIRLEDIDRARCTPELESQMLDDLQWLGIQWDGEPRRQSEHFTDYQEALDKLRSRGLIYPAFMTRGDIRRAVAEKTDAGLDWPHDPDGSPHYPGDEKQWSNSQQNELLATGQKHAWRLNMQAALSQVGKDLFWQEFDAGNPENLKSVTAHAQWWGDVVLARSDTPTSYHLAVTVDDALQNITHVVRGRDLYEATSVHRLLQELLDLPVPIYHHHDLVIDEDGRKLSKSNQDVSLRSLKERGVAPQDVPALFKFAS